MNMNEISYRIINTVTEVIGGFFLTVAFIISVFCILNALLILADEYRVVFVRLMRGAGILIAIFGLLLPFRGTVNPIATIISLWWCALFNGFLSNFALLQFIGLDIASWAFWCYYLTNVANEELIFLLKIGDFALFIVLPTVFGLILVSKNASSLDGDYKSVRQNQKMQYQIPLRSIIAKFASWFEKLIPPN
ncbi:hypothetical protein M9Y10_022959 [Tritrichomonas musculus]|uniref:Uncharacterized protein n=1 Tax=Tritrichomonas musculus TaxID=1915356 RepID=A0ABR2KTT3_9EUKA